MAQVQALTLQAVPTEGPRAAMIAEFLRQAGWAEAAHHPLAGDASFRRYTRLIGPRGRAMLMDCPPERESVAPWRTVALFLQAQGLSVPEIYAHDEATGLLLMEDFGDDLYTQLLDGAPSGVPAREDGGHDQPEAFPTDAQARPMYAAAVEVLAHLWHQRATLPPWPRYDTALMMGECALLAEWCVPELLSDARQCAAASAAYTACWHTVLEGLPALPPVAVLRDFHAGNMIWLPERRTDASAAQQVGLLDFQDAVVGPPAYDLVSLLEDARRDVSPALAQEMLTAYLAATGMAGTPQAAAFHTAYAILGAQRNCKIIGIFHRLNRRDGKPRYLTYLPRVWRHLAHDLHHPALSPLRQWFQAWLPDAAARYGLPACTTEPRP